MLLKRRGRNRSLKGLCPFKLPLINYLIPFFGIIN